MLSADERRAWEDIQRFYADEAEEPVPATTVDREWPWQWAARPVEDLPPAVVAGGWISILLILFGAPTAGLALCAATALGWIWWHGRTHRSRPDA